MSTTKKKDKTKSKKGITPKVRKKEYTLKVKTSKVKKTKYSKAEVRSQVQSLKVICWNTCPCHSEQIVQAYAELIKLYSDYPSYFSSVETRILNKVIQKQ